MDVILNNLIGPLVAGGMTLIGAWWATLKAHRLDRRRRDEYDQQQAKHLLRAVRAELGVVRARYLEVMGDVGDLDDGQPVPREFRASQGYFSVYDTSGVMLGLVRDPDTVEKIIQAYTYMRALLDSYEIHNDLQQRFDQLHSAGNPEAANALKELNEQMPIIQDTHHKALQSIQDAHDGIDHYLKANAG